MSQFERIYEIDRLLRGRIAPSKQRMMNVLEVSEPTLKRDLEYMRSRLNAPIIWDRQAGGYRYGGDGPEFSLPGLWFSGDEIHALLLMLHILDQIQPSFLRDQMKPFHDRLRAMTRAGAGPVDSIESRIELVASPTRLESPAVLNTVVRATLARRRLRMKYESRSRGGALTEREVSPGRLIYYRNNWYLDAWCHHAAAVRRFAVDAMSKVEILAAAAREIPAGPGRTGYGIFSGAPVNEAVLRFAPAIAPWIRTSQWHPDQRLEDLPDGGVLLRVPYSNDQEILMDVLRHGADVEVLAPESLRARIAQTLQSAFRLYNVPRRSASGARAIERPAAAV
jgi:predicted DNA-binding transcriptional regulator YafY